METLNYIFVGAGPANLVAANYLLDIGLDGILVVEQGRDLGKRYCPTVHTHTCAGCRKGCDVVQGVGGSAAIFGNKFCYFPASSGILDKFESVTLEAAFRYLESCLFPHFEPNLNRINAPAAHLGIQKSYETTIVPADEFSELIDRLAGRLFARGCLKKQFSVDSIVASTNGLFRCTSTQGCSHTARNVVIGTGRSSHQLAKRIFRDFGIALLPDAPDIGIRLEASLDTFSTLYHYQPDPKFKQTYPFLGSARTFCGEPRGHVIPVRFGESFYAEGAYLPSLSSLNSVALVARSEYGIDFEELESWCKQVNSHCNRSLRLASIDCPRSELTQHVIDAVLTIPIWPSPSVQELLLTFIRDHLTALIHDADSDGRTQLAVYAPSIDRYWPRPRLEQGLATSVPGLFVLGDATGLSRGFVQAFTSGAAWAVAQGGTLPIKESEWFASV